MTLEENDFHRIAANSLASSEEFRERNSSFKGWKLVAKYGKVIFCGVLAVILVIFLAIFARIVGKSDVMKYQSSPELLKEIEMIRKKIERMDDTDSQLQKQILSIKSDFNGGSNNLITGNDHFSMALNSLEEQIKKLNESAIKQNLGEQIHELKAIVTSTSLSKFSVNLKISKYLFHIQI